MADAYVDLVNGNDTNDGLTWVNAELTFQAGITTAGSGGRCFVQTSTDGTTKDTASGARTLTFPGTDQVPFGLYGVKNGTATEPPTDSDLTVRGVDNLPIFESTGGGSITVDETTGASSVAININGIRLDADGALLGGTIVSINYNNCELDFDGFITSGSGSLHKGVNCEYILFDATTHFRFDGNNSIFEIVGGLLSGTAPTNLIDNAFYGSLSIYGCDLSLVVGTLLDSAANRGFKALIKNCKLATGVTRITGTAPGTGVGYIEIIGSSDETGLGSGESVRDYAKEYFRGTILNEATFVRTGGVSDGVASWSLALTPRASSTKESLLALDTPWFGGIVEGDATTSKDFTVHIANSSGSDLTDADVWLELLYPSLSGVTQHEFDISSRSPIDATPSTVADDTVSDWSTGSGGKNAQKIVITATPDYQGPIYGRVMFAQAGTTTLYVDPKVYVTDT